MDAALLSVAELNSQVKGWLASVDARPLAEFSKSGGRAVFEGATIETLLKAKEQKRLKKKLSWLRRPHVLLLDEVGYEPLSPEQAHVFFQIVNTRYETGSIVMTSDKPFSKWAELMSDEAVATAMLDRLLHHALVFSLKGDSYLMKDRLRVEAVGFE
jgi:DNA replication protein DnaC